MQILNPSPRIMPDSYMNHRPELRRRMNRQMKFNDLAGRDMRNRYYDSLKSSPPTPEYEKIQVSFEPKHLYNFNHPDPERIVPLDSVHIEPQPIKPKVNIIPIDPVKKYL